MIETLETIYQPKEVSPAVFQNSRLSYLVPESMETKLAPWRRHDSHMKKRASLQNFVAALLGESLVLVFR